MIYPPAPGLHIFSSLALHPDSRVSVLISSLYAGLAGDEGLVAFSAPHALLDLLGIIREAVLSDIF